MNQEELTQARLNHAAGELHASVATLVDGRPLDQQLVQQVADLVRRHRQHCKDVDGLDFPVMQVIVFPARQALELVRKDWDVDSVQTWILNCTVKYPDITAGELAFAVKGTWPDYRRSLDIARAVQNYDTNNTRKQ